MKKICVIGSLNIDMAARTARFPARGETLPVDAFEVFVGGGKGANQAVAAGRLGADVRMVGRLGDRFFGAEYAAVLDANGVRRDAVDLIAGEYPGVAYIAVDAAGDNRIFVYPGANACVTPAYIDEHWARIADADVFLFQQEIPAAANLHAMRRIKEIPGKTVILDPAPAGGFAPESLAYADLVTPNETELAQITGLRPESADGHRAACQRLHALGAGAVVAKTGARGAYLSVRDGGFTAIPGFRVAVVDTTAAGDSFNAGLAWGLSAGLALPDAVRLGHAVAALSTTRFGAQTAMPDRAALLAFLDAEDAALAGRVRAFPRRPAST